MRAYARKFTLGPEPEGFWAKLRYRLRELLFGFFLYEFWHELNEQRARYADTMNTLLLGEFIGIPLLNSVVTLRLLPYLLPDLQDWKKRQAEDVEVLERHPDIH